MRDSGLVALSSANPISGKTADTSAPAPSTRNSVTLAPALASSTPPLKPIAIIR
jgi:hypothetical protein